MKEMKRLLALVLCFVMLIGILPVSAFATTDEPVDALVVFTDLHSMHSGNTSTGDKGYKQAKITNMMTALKNTGLPFSSVHSGGDAFSSNSIEYTGYTDTLTGYIQGVLGDVPVGYVWSDHDRAALDNFTSKTKLDKTSHLSYGAGADGVYGTNDDANYYVYYLSMGDLCSYDRYGAGFNYTQTNNSTRTNAGFTATVAQAIDNFEADAEKLLKDRPLFIISHQPLFDNRNDNAWAEDWFDAINEVAKEMDVAFFYGHNHKYDNANDYYYAKGSTMPVATADNWDWKYETNAGYLGYLPSMDLSSESKTLNFTHMCGGYFDPGTTGSTSNTTREGTAVAVTIYEDSIQYTTYNSSGEYEGNYALNKTVKRDHAKVEVPEEPTTEPTEPETTEPSTPVAPSEQELSANGVTVKAPGLSGLNAAAVTSGAAYEAAAQVLEEGFVAYDITVEGFENESGTATVALPLPEGVTDPVVYYVSDDGLTLDSMTITNVDDGYVTFQTTHFTTYAVGNRAADDWTTIQEPTAATTVYKYTQVTDLSDADKYAIVSPNDPYAVYAPQNSNNKGVTVDISGTSMTSDYELPLWTHTDDGYLYNDPYYLRNANSVLGTSATTTGYPAASQWTITNMSDGLFQLKTGYVYLNGTDNNFPLSRSSSNRVRLFAYAGSEATGGSEGLYGRIVGTPTLVVAKNASTFRIDQQVDSIQIELTSDKSNLTTINGSDEKVTWSVADYEGAPGEYTMTIEYDGVELGTVTLNVLDRTPTGISMADADKTITVERDTPASAAVINVTLTYEDGPEETKLPLSMLTGTLNLESNGTYGNLTLNYPGLDSIGGITVNVVDKKVSDEVNFPKYPSAGAVELTKTATPLDQNTGTTRIELSAAGLPHSQGVDVIVMLDLSSSMDICVKCGGYAKKYSSKNYSCTCQSSTADKKNITTRVDELADAMEELEIALKASPNASDIKIAVMDFNGYSNSGSYAYNTNDRMSDKNGLTNGIKNQVYTGTSNGALNAKAFIPASELDVSTFNYGLTCSSGTNYDYAFDAIYQLGNAIKEENGENQRPLFVLFMSDGAPNQYNFFHTTGGSTGSHEWNHWLTGDLSKNTTDFTCSHKAYNSIDDIIYTQSTHGYYFNGPNNDHRMANAIKGNPDENYVVIRKNQGTNGSGVDAVTSKLIALTTDDPEYNNGKHDDMYKLPGLGATMYSLAFHVGDDGTVKKAAALNVLERIASSADKYVNAETEGALAKAFNAIGGEIAKAAENAVFSDQLGDNFNLQMNPTIKTSSKNGDGTNVTTNAISTDITVVVNNIYLPTQVGMTINGHVVVDADVGKAYGTPNELERVLFAATTVDGKEVIKAYTTAGGYKLPNDTTVVATVLNADGTVKTYGTNIMVDDVICAKSFYYNTTSNEKTVGGKTIDSEAFVWNVGTVNEKKYTLSYLVYLEGSIEGKRNSGNYATNNYAKMQYINWIGNTVEQEVISPSVAWESATVSYAFYLVDNQGNPLYASGNQAPNFALAHKVTNPIVAQEILLNSAGADHVINFDAIDTSVLPSGYVIYDSAATYAVTTNSGTGGGSWVINGSKLSADGKSSSTYVTGYHGNEYSNALVQSNGDGYSYAATTVWFAVEWKEGVVDDTVVIDYGLPVNISVLANDMLGVNGKLLSVGNTSDKPTEPGLNGGFNTAPDAAKFGNTVAATFGTATVNGTQVLYKLNDKNMAMNTYDRFTYAASAGEGRESTHYYYGDVTVIPATTVYYEDDFVTLKTFNSDGSTINGWTSSTPNGIQAEDRPGKHSLVDANNVYGYDGAYKEMSEHSMKSAAQVTVNANTYATAEFTFYGTGFDVISLTDSTTGLITVKVWERNADGSNGTMKKNTMVNTFYGYTKDANGEWIVDSSSTGALYQVPVIKIDGLAYKQYNVRITAAYNQLMDVANKGSYNVYLDAIRIYNPAGDQYDDANKPNDVIQNAYTADGEGWPKYEELRNKIIGVEDFNAQTTAKEDGVIFIDHKPGSYTVADYTNYGPNNELYLAPGQSVAFELDLQEYVVSGKSIVADVQLGAKSADGKPVQVTLSADGLTSVRDFKTTTDMYYSIKHMLDLGTTLTATDGKNDSKTIVVLTNTAPASTGGVVSITNIKTTFTQKPAANSGARIGYSREIVREALLMIAGSPENVILNTYISSGSLSAMNNAATAAPIVSAPEAEVTDTTAPAEIIHIEKLDPISAPAVSEVIEEAAPEIGTDPVEVAPQAEVAEEAPAAESQDAPVAESQESGFSLKAIVQRIVDALSMLLTHLFN